MDPNTMTLDEAREWLAKNSGPWSLRNGRWYHRDWHKSGSGQRHHPIPPTLDAIAACMPEGWYWWINHCALFGVETYVTKAVQKSAPLLRAESQAESEILARARLAVACRMAAKGEGR